MTVPNFTIDAVFHSVKELQSEKNCLEYKLNELRGKRRQLEKTAENTRSKLMQVRDIHIKMSETLKMAELKVSKTQNHAISLEEANQARRQRITELNNKIEIEKEFQQNDINDFEDKLVELATELKNSRVFYKDDNVQHELISSEKKINELEGKSFDNHKKLEQLKKDLQKMNKPVSTDDEGVPVEIRRTVWMMIKEENQSFQKFLNQLQEELNSIHETLQDFMK